MERGSKKKEATEPSLGKLLAKVALGGLIDTCLVDLANGRATVEAIDPTRDVRLFVTEKVGGDDDVEVGLSGLNTIIRLFDRGGAKYEINKSYFNVVLPGNEKVKLITIEPDDVPSLPRKELDMEELLDNAPWSGFVCPPEMLEKLSDYRSLLSIKTVSLKVDKKGNVSLSSETTKDRQFNVPKIAKIDEDCGKEVGGEFFAEHFEAVLKATQIDKDEEVYIHLTPLGGPLIVVQGNNWWTLQSFESV